MADDRMTGFGYKTGWLAIREADPAAILATLGARDAGPATWPEGVNASYDRRDTVFVTPPLPGAGGANWILVAGSYIASNYESLDVAGLSAALGREVQLFVTHRVVELHRWERAVDGARVRAFEYLGEAGEVRQWYGQPDPIELAVGLPPAFDMDRGSEDEWVSAREDDVMRVAGAWSVDPTSLEDQPAAAPLSLARFPVPAHSPTPELKVVNITDLITSSLDVDELNERIAERERERGIDG